MTLKDLRSEFDGATEFYLCIIGHLEKIKITNLMWGNICFNTMELLSISAIAKDTVLIETDMPEIVFEAWKNYSEMFE